MVFLLLHSQIFLLQIFPNPNQSPKPINIPPPLPSNGSNISQSQESESTSITSSSPNNPNEELKTSNGKVKRSKSKKKLKMSKKQSQKDMNLNNGERKDKVGVSKCGYMRKEGGGYKSWKNRFFKLKDGKVEYYTYSDEAEKKGELILSQVSKIEISDKWENTLEIHTHKRVYKFAADNVTDMTEWKEALETWL